MEELTPEQIRDFERAHRRTRSELIGSCKTCRNGIATADLADNTILVEYFSENGFRCWVCGSMIDLRKIVFDHILDEGPFRLFILLNAESTAFSFRLRQNELTTVDIVQQGVPEEAIILDLNLTPIGGSEGVLHPTLISGNSPLAHWPPTFGKELHLAPVPFGDYPAESEVNALITWLKPIQEDMPAWVSLVDAFKHFRFGRFADVVLPAQIAVETKLQRVLQIVMAAGASSSRDRKNFLQSISYWHKLSVLLADICARSNLPFISPQIKGGLNILRKRRNEMAHRGRLESAFGQNEAADALTAAFFVFRFLDVVLEYAKTS